MTDQLLIPEFQDAPKLVQAFMEFHADNPQVYSELRRLSLELLGKSRQHYGIGGLFEVLRWQHAMSTSDTEFKLNNNHRAFYARLLMHNEPTLKGFFELRRSQGDGWAPNPTPEEKPRRNWFSNFLPMETPLVYQGLSYWTVEHFFQAMKCPQDRLDLRKQIAEATTPGRAKKLGRGITIRPDWEFLKVDIMRDGLEHKFAPGTEWHKKLMATGEEPIVEWNYWHDNVWGDCACPSCKVKPGQNYLGKLLMEIRDKEAASD